MSCAFCLEDLEVGRLATLLLCDHPQHVENLAKAYALLGKTRQRTASAHTSAVDIPMHRSRSPQRANNAMKIADKCAPKKMNPMDTEKKVMKALRGSRPHDCGLSMSSSSYSCSRVLHRNYCAGGRHDLSKKFTANEHPSVSSWVQVCSRCPYMYSYFE